MDEFAVRSMDFHTAMAGILLRKPSCTTTLHSHPFAKKAWATRQTKAMRGTDPRDGVPCIQFPVSRSQTLVGTQSKDTGTIKTGMGTQLAGYRAEVGQVDHDNNPITRKSHGESYGLGWRTQGSAYHRRHSGWYRLDHRYWRSGSASISTSLLSGHCRQMTNSVADSGVSMIF